MRDLVLQAPPNLARGVSFKSARELMKAGRFGNRIRRLSTRSLNAVFDLFTKSAGDHLDGWFEGDLVKALFGFDAIVGNYASPYTPGTAYVLLHHAFGDINGRKRAWGHAVGGMGAITQAMARSAAERAGDPQHGGRSECRPQAPLYGACSGRCAGRRLSSSHAGLALRLRDVPDEPGALRASELCGAARP